MNLKKTIVGLALMMLVNPVLAGSRVSETMNLSFLPEEKFSMKLADADVKNIIRIIGETYQINFLVNESVTGTMTVNFNNVPIRDAFSSILRNFELNFVRDGAIVRIDGFGNLKKKRVNVPIITRAIPVKYTFDSTASISKSSGGGSKRGQNLTTLAKSLEKLLSGRDEANISVIRRTNTLLVTDIEESVDKIENIIRGLDKKSRQIKILARIIEANNDFIRQLGVSWGGVTRGKIGVNDVELRGGGNLDPTNPPLTAREGFGRQGAAYVQDGARLVTAQAGGASIDFLLGRIGNRFLDMQLAAMEKNEEGKILANPKVITQNNMMAMIKSGLRVPIQKEEQGTITVEYVDALIRLDALPHIIDDRIFLDLKVIKDDVDQSRSIDGNPYLLKKEITTKVLVADGETVVIGGLISQKESQTVKGIPYLSKIPLLGWLFRFEENINVKTELLIFITPSIIKEVQES